MALQKRDDGRLGASRRGFFSILCWWIGLSAASSALSQDRLPQDQLSQLSNVRLTAAAWSAFLDKNWKLAISKADDCIRRHRLTADRLQANLEQARAPVPPTGPATADEIKAIFSRGPLNDVATCWIIKAWALEQLQQRDEAEKAFAAAAKYTYARCWDPPPHGWFWSPAEEAIYR